MMIIPAPFHRDCFYQHALLLRAFTMLTMLSSPPCFRNALPLSVNVMRSMGTVPSFNRLMMVSKS